MSIDINAIEQEERSGIEDQLKARVDARLEAARQSAQDRFNNAQADLEEVTRLIAERTPVVEEPTPEAAPETPAEEVTEG